MGALRMGYWKLFVVKWDKIKNELILNECETEYQSKWVRWEKYIEMVWSCRQNGKWIVEQI